MKLTLILKAKDTKEAWIGSICANAAIILDIEKYFSHGWSC